MEPEGSLQPSQVPTTCPCPEPYRSSPCPQTHFLKIRLNIILRSMPGFSKWSLSFRFSHQNPVHTSPLPHTCYMPRPCHSSRFDHQNNIWWGVHIIKLLIMYFSLPPVTLRSSLNVSDHVSHPYKTTDKILVMYSLIFIFIFLFIFKFVSNTSNIGMTRLIDE